MAGHLLLWLLLGTSVGQEFNYNLSEDDQPDIYIGGLFEEETNSSDVTAFLSAIDYVNRHQIIIGKRLEAIVRTVPQHDSFQVEKTFCELAAYGVAAVLGPSSPSTSHHVQSLCDTLEIPHLTTRWEPAQRRSSCRVNLHPHPTALSKAVRDIVEAWNWEGFTVLYDDYEALMKIQSLVKMADDRGYLVTVRQLSYDEEYGYRSVLQEIKFSEERKLIIECSADILYDVLVQAQQVGLMGIEYSYIITSLDFQTIDHTPFMWGRTNITGIRLVNPDTEHAKEMAAAWADTSYRHGIGSESPTQEEESTADDYNDEFDDGRPPTTLPPPSTSLPPPTGQDQPIPTLQSSLIHDAVLLFAKSLNRYGPVPVHPLQCQGMSFFRYGYSLVNYMRLSEVDGMSGLVKFDHEGFRTELQLDVIELTTKGFNRKGFWNGTLTVFHQKPGKGWPDDGEDLRNVTFIVLIALTPPYNMLKENSKALQGNDRFEGFGVDLIHELSLMSGFNYTFKAHHNKKSGEPVETLPNGTRVWDGLIGEVIAGRADLAIADITITDKRLKDADFTDPFMNLGISILHRKPTKAPPSLFSFMSPFSTEVWAYMMSAYVGVSLLLFVMARISPYEWTNPYPCVQNPEELENQFSIFNSFWFTVGSLMQQGSDVAPIASSTRLVAAIWWFFTLIMVSSYTAQLASFLTHEDPIQPFENYKELANQNKIKYGAKENGTTVQYFQQDKKNPIYKKIAAFMAANSACCMVGDNEAGVKRVLAGMDYAFFMESVSIEYEVERNCNLTQVGGLLDQKGYGIVMKQNSTYRNVLSKHIVQLQEKGKLSVLKDKWWKEKRGGGACKGETVTTEASKLSLANTGGVFVVLVGGCIFGVLVAICEILWYVYQYEGKASYKEELMEELKFILQCHASVKPVRQASTGDSYEDVIRGRIPSSSSITSA